MEFFEGSIKRTHLSECHVVKNSKQIIPSALVTHRELQGIHILNTFTSAPNTSEPIAILLHETLEEFTIQQVVVTTSQGQSGVEK
jgi:hypothetical protein